MQLAMRDEVTLNECEQRIVRHVAKRREQVCRDLMCHVNRINRDRDTYSIGNYGAELAFCILADIYPDFTYDSFAPMDCILPDGRTVNVKWTDYKNGFMACNVAKTKRKPADLYVLMIGTFPHYRFAGYATKEEVFASPIDPGTVGEPFYRVEQKYLHKEF